ncbi:hypothetical protein PY365_12215 [Roseiarcaceae bacterium H3SJ34-1]|uniref:hypothetical protein n=1 Tax=Terripilifer ovatus TaxID=3032367 RepID=UPI003AB981BD|nr:hypothetical protein [Roseiarcaceae bacterium H3SJ34-1]
MRPFMHLLSILLLLPNLVFAAGFLLLGHAIAGATILVFFDRLFSDALTLMTWGIFAIGAVFLAILVGGFFRQTRWLAASCIAILSVASLAILVVLGSGPISFGQWLFLLPGALSLGIGAWLAAADWP